MPQTLIQESGTKHPFQLAQGDTQEGTGKPLQGETHSSTEAGEKEAPLGEVPNAVLLFQNSILIAIVLVIFGLLARRKLDRIPTGFQNFAEWVAERLNIFTVEVIGPGGEKFTPLIGTIFLYILLMNLVGLIPGFHSPTANISITFALGIVVFIYSEFHGVRSRGMGGHIMHFMGPKMGKYPLMAPLLFPVEIISECIRPFTLAIRLFGNIFGEDVILMVLAGLGVASVATKWVPFHFLVLLLALLTALVQAMVFAILTCVYISLASSHDDEDHGAEAANDGQLIHAGGH